MLNQVVFQHQVLVLCIKLLNINVFKYRIVFNRGWPHVVISFRGLLSLRKRKRLLTINPELRLVSALLPLQLLQLFVEVFFPFPSRAIIVCFLAYLHFHTCFITRKYLASLVFINRRGNLNFFVLWLFEIKVCVVAPFLPPTRTYQIPFIILNS